MQIVKYFMLCIAFFACSKNLVDERKNLSYSMEKQKSITGGSYLDLNFFNAELRDRFIPAPFSVNGILFEPKKDTLSHIIPVSPGQFTIKATYIGKVQNQVHVNVTKGDSLVLKIYLKNDPQPLID
ncbi:MAG TPA: hypothetical protein VLA13_09670 [Massilibacterium sp.]|nr:hypothetical protein [Massilibacterium sp.]